MTSHQNKLLWKQEFFCRFCVVFCSTVWKTLLTQMRVSYLVLWCVCLSVSICFYQIESKPHQLHCRDPDLGGQSAKTKFSQKKFLVLNGAGAGLGNYLIFYPAAYYFAALTGRDLLIQDGSLVAEMCSVVTCGYPLYSEMAMTYPSVLDQEKLNKIKGVNMYAFRDHVSGNNLANEQLLRADGYKYSSGWYLDHNHTEDCIAQLTGCANGDISCHDRHALERLVRGPFKSQYSLFEESRVVGVPQNLKHGLMTLPHSYAPRLDASIHLRCQFKHFEFLVGPEDTAWPNYLKEVDEFLGSKDFNKGIALFQHIEQKIMSELHLIRSEKEKTRRVLSTISNVYQGLANKSTTPQRQLTGALTITALNATELDFVSEHDTFQGTKLDKIYVYLASDNERVKEALTEYLLGHAHISIMRVKTLPTDHIVHAKNIGYMRGVNNNTGTLNLVLDWYAMSLSNVVFAWRRDSDLLSTFAQSSIRMSGNAEDVDAKIHINEEKTSTTSTVTEQTEQDSENDPEPRKVKKSVQSKQAG